MSAGEQNSLKAVLEHVFDAVLWADDRMRLLDANPAAVELLGFERDELLRLDFAAITAPDYRASVPAMWSSFLKQGRAEGEWKLARRDGALIPVQIRARAGIQPGLHLSVIRDVTVHQRLETALRDARKTETVAMLAGGVAHDLKNLLVGILGGASLLLAELPPSASGNIRTILDAGQRAADLAGEMVAYVARKPPEAQPVDLNETILQLRPLMESLLPKRVRLEFHLDSAPGIRAVPGQVQQVIMNLVINAGQAICQSAPGVVRIFTGSRDIDRGTADPEAAGLAEGKYAVVQVEDTGRGMDQTTRQKIFTPFFTTKPKGSGIGLAAVRRIVVENKGVIWVRSAPRSGSCFTVLLPVAGQ